MEYDGCLKFLRMFVDNTSVESALRKRWAESYNISEVLGRVLSYLNAHHITIFPEYVTTKDNQADAWSRNRYDTWRYGGIHELATVSEAHFWRQKPPFASKAQL